MILEEFVIRITMKEEIQIHHNNITNQIHMILNETRSHESEDLSKNETLKESIFAQLQEIEEVSWEIMNITAEFEDDQDLVKTLQVFGNARFSLAVETGLNSVWGTIQHNLPDMEKIFYTKYKMEE